MITCRRNDLLLLTPSRRAAKDVKVLSLDELREGEGVDFTVRDRQFDPWSGRRA